VIFVVQSYVSVVATVTLAVFWVGYSIGFLSESLQRRQSELEDAPVPQRLAPRSTFSLLDEDEPSPGHDRSPTVIQPDEPCRPAENLRLRRSNADGRWFKFGHRPHIQFYVYSAIWDDRPSVGLPLIRVLAAATTSSAGVLTVDPVPLEYGVYCRFHLPDGRWLGPVSVVSQALPIGYGWWLNNRLVRELIFNCPLPRADEGLRPDGVSMLVGGPVQSTAVLEDDPLITACVPVEYPEKPTVKADFAVCVQAWTHC